MATFRRLFPSRRHLALAFAVCAFPVYTWSIYQFIEQVPGWLYYLSVWDVLNIFAYTQLFALAESALLLLGLTLIAALLPARLFRANFVAIGTALVVLTAGWAIAAQYNDGILRTLPMRLLAVWAVIYAVSILVFYALVQRYDRLSKALTGFAERLLVLLYVYVPVSLVSLGIVIMRNV